MSEAARSRRIEPDFGSQMDRPAVRADRFPPPAGDPLAELARLVGQDDPFRAMFNAPASPRPAARPPVEAPAAAEPEAHHFEAADQADAEPAIPPEESWHQADSAGDYHAELPHEAADYDEGHAAPVDYDAVAMAEHEHHEGAPATVPELWAEPPLDAPAPLSDESASTPAVPRRPLVVLFAVLALTGGGLAATFLARTGTSIAATGGAGAPVILASTTPAKIQQVDTATAANAEDADAALLSRNGETHGGPVKVVPSQEQPIDLAQLPKATGADTPQIMSQNPFPEPRMVKTFVVRADGKMIPTGSAGGVAPRSPDSLPQMAALPAAAGGTALPAALPATPKATRAPTTPKAVPTDGGAGADATDSVAPKPRQVAAPGPRAMPPKAKPTEVADATPGTEASSTPQTEGGFALQLAASPSEQDARGAFTRLQKKYSELGSYQPHIKKAGTPEKPIYRLRVGSMGQDQAKTLCSQLQASGGSCFVVRN